MSDTTTQTPENKTAVTPPNTVPKDDFDKILNESKSYKAKIEAAEAEKAALAQKLQELEESKLKGANDFKSLYEKEKEMRLAALKDKETIAAEKKKLAENIVYNSKYNAAKDALLKAGLRAEATKILDREDLEAITVETTSNGRMILHGVDTFVDSFKKSYDFAFSNATVAKINNSVGSVTGSEDTELTAAQMVALETKDPKKYKELLPKFLEQRKQK